MIGQLKQGAINQLEDAGQVRTPINCSIVHPLGNPEDDVMDVPGSTIANDPVPRKEVGLCEMQGLGKVCWYRPVSFDMFYKVLCADDFVLGPGGGREGGQGR